MNESPSDGSLDYGAVFEFTDSRTGDSFGVTLATVLQCLCIAEQRFLVPSLDKEWEAATIPPVIRERSNIDKMEEPDGQRD